MSLKDVAQKFSLGHLFLGFNAILLAGVGGMIYFLRAVSDPYSPVSLDLINIGLVSFVWVVALLAFIGMIVCLKYRNQLQNLGACLVLLSFFEIIFIGYFTLDLFTYAPRNHRDEDHAQLVKMVAKLNIDTAARNKGPLLFVNATLKGRTLVLQYKAGEDASYYKSTLRESLSQEACGYLAVYFRHDVLTSIAYNINQGQNHDIIAFNPNDCNGSTAASIAPPTQTEKSAADISSNLTPSAARETGSGHNIEWLATRVDSLQDSINHLNQQIEQLAASTSSLANHSKAQNVKDLQDRLDKCEKEIESLSHTVAKMASPPEQIKDNPPAQLPK